MVKKLCYLAGGLTLCAFSFTSCVDNSYDLDDVDFTVGIGSNFATPWNSLSDLTLENLLDLEGDVVKTEGDLYVVSQGGSANITPITINRIVIGKPDDAVINSTFGLPIDASLKSQAAKVKSNASVAESVNDFLNRFCYMYKLEGDAPVSYNFSATGNGVSEDITEISHANVLESEITLNVSFVFPQLLKSVEVENFLLTLPKGFSVLDAKLQHNGNNVDVVLNKENGTITINKMVIYRNKDLQLKLTVDGATVNQGGAVTFKKESHTIDMVGDVSINKDVTVTIKRENLDESQLSVDNLLNLQSQLSSLNAVGVVSMNGKLSFKEELIVNRFSGVLEHEIEDPNPINVNNLPDFLADESVRLDLKNPAVYLRVNYGAGGGEGAEANVAHMKLTSNYNNGTAPVTVEMPSLDFKGGRQTVYCVSNEPMAAGDPIPAGFEGAIHRAPDANQPVHDICSLIRVIPHHISVDMDKLVLKCNDVNVYDPANVHKTYDVDFDYMLYTPLKFGKEFTIVYRAQEDGWHEDIMDNEIYKYRFEKLKLTATVSSNVPLNLILDVTPIDVNGEKISDIAVYTNENNKADGSIQVAGNAENQQIELYLEPNASNYRSVIERLDGIKFVATAKYASEDMLKKNQNLKVTNLKVQIVGNVIADLN